ncbi:hypothetical protein [Photobacterium sp. J15]|uniref:hypothetical protein n=1 Tax=Photobacterium sp. J15 TaxID=265901 RepID=UPI0007E49D39|nr:hypothetical protein [Photobacterium sp. J15]
MSLERQLEELLTSFEQALAAQNWDKLASLDTKLQQAIPKIQQKNLTQAAKLQLQRINSLYSTMIAAGEREKARIQQQISQQADTREGMHAYMQNR